MKPLLTAGVVTGVLLAAPAGSVLAQPPTAAPSPVVAMLLPFVGDAAFQKELDLTPQQADQLLARQQKAWDEAYTALPLDRAKERDRQVATAAAFRAALTPPQFGRAEQLARQLLWGRTHRNPGPLAPAAEGTVDPTRVRASVLREYPDLADALKLSDDQKQLVKGAEPVTADRVVMLSSAQAEAARRLCGRVPDARWKAERDDRRAKAVMIAWYADTPPGALGLTAARDVREDVRITDEQERELVRSRDAWADFKPIRFEVSPQTAREKMDAFLADADKVMAAILTLEQRRRLGQLAVRYDHDPAFGRTEAPLIQNLAKELGITPAQQKAFDALTAAHAEAVARAALAGREWDAARKAILAASGDREKGYEAALTPEQREKLKAITGDPLAGRGVGVDSRGHRYDLPDAFRPSRENAFGRYTDELTLLSLGKSIQGELKLTPEQVKAVLVASREHLRKYGSLAPRGLNADAKEVRDAEGRKFIEASLPKLLTAEQAKRFREVVLQRHECMPASAVSLGKIPSAVVYPGVAEAVGLAADQRAKLLDGVHPADVLTDEQKKAIRGMLGERFTGDYETLPRSTPPSNAFELTRQREAARLAFLISGPSESLPFTPEGQDTLSEVLNRYQVETANLRNGPGARPNRLTPFGGEDLNTAKARTTAHFALIKVLVRIDGRGATNRVDELLLQSAAAFNLRAAFTRPEAAKVLNLSPTQVVRMMDAEEEFGRAAGLVMGAQLPAEKRAEVQRQLRDRLDERLLAELTPEQKTAWKELVGEPWNGFTKRPLLGPPYRTH